MLDPISGEALYQVFVDEAMVWLSLGVIVSLVRSIVRRYI